MIKFWFYQYASKISDLLQRSSKEVPNKGFLFIKSIYRYDPNNKYLMTAFFGLFIFLAIFNAVNARTYRINTFANLFKNRVFIFVLLFVAVVQIVLIYYGGDIFRATGLTKYEFEIMLLLAFTVIPFDFIRKIILKKRNIVREI